ncbi:MAG: ribonuclease III, partial [Methanobacterium sp.]|nr:ribonuclease III [Methanobacterium sp.]
MKLLNELLIKPLNQDIYKLAFLHQSFSNENNLNECYERLEFLGDAVLDLVVSEYLYNSNSQLTEGQLTRMRANYVCKRALYTYSTELGLDKHIKLGVGVELTRREVNSIIS